MKCVIPGRNVKLFGRSIHCLSRIGDELFFEALPDGLALRTVNSSRSAYACFIFSKTFLSEYEQGADQVQSSNPAEMLKCKITMKSCLNIFKSLPSLEKTVDECKIIFQPDKCRLVFTLRFKHGIVKTHNLTYQECESLQAVFVKDLCPNSICAQSKVLQDTVANFPTSCEEITLAVCPTDVRITNYVDDEPDPTKVMHTVTTLVQEEFDYFQIGIDTKVTFCLKELRAILAFSEFVNQPISVHFEQAGKPIVFSFDSDDLYQGDFVLATLSESDATLLSESTQQSTQVVREKENVPTKGASRKEPPTSSKASSSRSVQAASTSTSRATTSKHKSNVDSRSSKSKTESANTHKPSAQRNPETPVAPVTTRTPNVSHTTRDATDTDMVDDFFSESFPYQQDMFKSNTTATQKQKQTKHDNNDKKSSSSQHRRMNSSFLRQSSSAMQHDGDVDENEDVVANSPPPAKKAFKSIFFGESCSNNGGKKSPPVKGKVAVLAADTDDEDDED